MMPDLNAVCSAHHVEIVISPWHPLSQLVGPGIFACAEADSSRCRTRRPALELKALLQGRVGRSGVQCGGAVEE